MQKLGDKPAEARGLPKRYNTANSARDVRIFEFDCLSKIFHEHIVHCYWGNVNPYCINWIRSPASEFGVEIEVEAITPDLIRGLFGCFIFYWNKHTAIFTAIGHLFWLHILNFFEFCVLDAFGFIAFGAVPV